MVNEYSKKMVKEMSKEFFYNNREHKEDKVYTESDLLNESLVSTEGKIHKKDQEGVVPTELSFLCSLVREAEQAYYDRKRKYEIITVYKKDNEQTIDVKVFGKERFDNYNDYKTKGKNLAEKIDESMDYQVNFFFE